MSAKMWTGVIAVLILIVVGLRVLGDADLSPVLRSNHSMPAAIPPAAPVAITDGGKMFHKPECTYIHGKAKLVDGKEAVEQGYAPCVRCEKELSLK